MPRRLVQTILALLGVGLLFAFVQYFPLPRATYFWDRTFDTGHILIFGVLAVLLLIVANATFGDWRVRWQYVAVVVVATTLGLLLEIWQTTVGRDSEWIDWFNDFVGIVAFAAVFAMFDKRLNEFRVGIWKRKWLALTATLAMLIGLLPMVFVLQNYVQQSQIVPHLVDFSLPWEGRFYYVQTGELDCVPPPDVWPTDAYRPVNVAKFHAEPGSYPGLILYESHPDWSGYEFLELDVLLADETSCQFVLRAHDQDHNGEVTDRFRKSVELQPGFQTLRIALADVVNAPQNRTLDLKRMRGMGLYAPDLERNLVLYVGDIRLAH